MVDVMLIGVGRIEDNDTKANLSENDSRDKKEVIFTGTGKILKNEEYQEQYLYVEYTAQKHKYEPKYKNENDESLKQHVEPKFSFYNKKSHQVDS